MPMDQSLDHVSWNPQMSTEGDAQALSSVNSDKK